MNQDRRLFDLIASGMTPQEIADQEGRSVSGVRGQVSRARRRQQALGSSPFDADARERQGAWLSAELRSSNVIRLEPLLEPERDFVSLLTERLRAAEAQIKVLEKQVGQKPIGIRIPEDDTERLTSWIAQLTGYRRIVFMPDIHLGDENEQAVQLAIQIIQAAQPDLVYYGGDAFDFNVLGRWLQAVTHVPEDALEAVADRYRWLVTSVHQAAPTAVQVIQPGNHEKRFDTYLSDKPGLAGTSYKAYAEMCRADGRVWWIHELQEVRFGKHYLMKHGTKASINTAKSEGDRGKWQKSRTQGHAPRPALWIERVETTADDLSIRGRIVTSAVSPCLSKLVPAYVTDTKESAWINGVTVIDVNLEGDDVHQTLVLFHERADGSLVAHYGPGRFVEPPTTDSRYSESVAKVERKTA